MSSRAATRPEATLFPPPASDGARAVDVDIAIMLAISTLVVLTVAGLVVWFGLRYREGAGRSARPLKSRGIEIGWAAFLTVGAVVLFVLGASDLLLPRAAPIGGRPIYVVGKQWMWKVQHPEGRREINTLHVPAGEPVRLVLTSQDVIHSFYVPAFRLKQDALPDRFTTLSFTPTRLGVYRLLCAEYCGSKHSEMIGSVVVMRPSDYQNWLDSGVEDERARPFLSLAGDGAEAFRRFGCGTCHTPESAPMAPRLDGLYGGQTRTRTGRLIIADDNYIRESILRPNAVIVAGYEPPSEMPSFEGRVTEAEIIALIEFIRSIRHGWPEEGP